MTPAALLGPAQRIGVAQLAAALVVGARALEVAVVDLQDDRERAEGRLKGRLAAGHALVLGEVGHTLGAEQVLVELQERFGATAHHRGRRRGVGGEASRGVRHAVDVDVAEGLGCGSAGG